MYAFVWYVLRQSSRHKAGREGQSGQKRMYVHSYTLLIPCLEQTWHLLWGYVCCYGNWSHKGSLWQRPYILIPVEMWGQLDDTRDSHKSFPGVERFRLYCPPVCTKYENCTFPSGWDICPDFYTRCTIWGGPGKVLELGKTRQYPLCICCNQQCIWAFSLL